MIDYINSRGHNTHEMTILEIGSWSGVSMEIFAANFKEVICIDPWEATIGTVSEQYDVTEAERLFDKRIKKYDNVRKIKERSEDIAESFVGMDIDIVYIDGEHTKEAVTRDLRNYVPVARKIIAGHDYWPNRFDGVIEAVNNVIGEPDMIFPDTSWIKEL